MPPCRLFLLTLLTVSLQAQAPEYAPTHQVTGSIRTWGSPQMADLLHLYEAGFHKLQPGILFEDDLKTTLTAVPGVYTGRADIGLLGREIWPTEVAAFTAQTGHSPRIIAVATGAFDVPKSTFALMVFVPVTNPLVSLATTQLARIFSGTNPAKTWGDLGLTGAWASRPIHLYGFLVDNDKSQIFADLIFTSSERWSNGLREFANSPGKDAGQLIVEAIAADPDAIGISNAHYATPAVRALPLSTLTHPDPIPATKATVAAHLYPLTREVYMILDAMPTAATIEFVRYVLSQQGQQAVRDEANYLPLTDEEAASQHRRLTAP